MIMRAASSSETDLNLDSWDYYFSKVNIYFSKKKEKEKKARVFTCIMERL